MSHPHPLTISLEGAGARKYASIGEPSGALEPTFLMGWPLEKYAAALVDCSARIWLFRAWSKSLVAHTVWKGWQSGWKYNWKFFPLLRSELGGVLFLCQERCTQVSNCLTASTSGGAL